MERHSQKERTEPETNNGHNWKPIGQKGGTVVPIRTYSGKRGSFRRSSTITGVSRTPKIVFYKCANCGITGKKTIGEDPSVVPDKKNIKNYHVTKSLFAI